MLKTKSISTGKSEADAIQERAEQIALRVSGRIRRGHSLMPAVKESRREFEKIFRILRSKAKGGSPLPAGADWLIDNQFLIEEHLCEAMESLPRNYDQLPILTTEPFAGYPRVYALAIELVSLLDARLEMESIASFIEAYQRRSPLSIGELWAVGGLLRIAVLEELRRLGSRLAEYAASSEASRFDDDWPDTAQTIRNGVQTLRAMEAASWKDFVESASRMEQILREDPAGAYARMDFASRDRYRHAVEEIARHSSLSEEAVARRAVHLALEAEARSEHARRCHVGYYLIDGGRTQLRESCGYKPDLKARCRNRLLGNSEAFYLVGVELGTLAFMVLLVSQLSVLTPESLALLLLLLPATEAAVAVMNQLVAYLFPPRLLPKLDFSDGVPADCATMVVVPTLLLSKAVADELMEQLEVRYLANRDPNLSFALLTDLPDTNHMEQRDLEVVTHCARGIEELNARYRQIDGRAPFLLLHREREWNPKQGAWMGWERKRGKLIQFNELLRGESDGFPVKAGNVSALRGIRYVITLDSDTQLPRDTARKLIGTIAHPLNRAVVDPVTRTVTEGYGILQPRIGVSVHAASRSRLARLFSGQTGYDLYTTAVSDVYQDLFGEGIYTGKGIYEVDTFEEVLSNRFPDDSLLSHDLIEGLYVRSALVTDVELIDDYPSHYQAYAKRRHRWVRGDWQIMRWLLPWVPDARRRITQNPLALIARWKIFDNLRRSVMEIMLLILLVAGWFFLPGGPGYWTTAVLVLMLFPTYSEALLALARLPFARQRRAVLQSICSNLVSGHVNMLLRLTSLAHQSCLMLDAIIRAIARKMTGKKLLEWETAAQAERSSRSLWSINAYLWVASLIASAIIVVLALRNSQALVYALPVLAAWVCSPFLIMWLNRPPLGAKWRLCPQDRAFLRETALRTWHYFETFCTPERNWLPPDNYQEQPPAAAERISPTNLGLYLNSILAARDFGYISTGEAARRLSLALASMSAMERYRGHFYNWYDPRSLEPLSPKYVSTVDSGNLITSLWTLKQGCLELLDAPAMDCRVWEGARDYCKLLAREIPDSGSIIRKLQDLLAQPAGDVFECRNRLAAALKEGEACRSRLREGQGAAGTAEIDGWLNALLNHLEQQRREIDVLFPWAKDDGNRSRLEQDGVEPLRLSALPSFYDKLRAELPGAEASIDAARTAAEALIANLRRMAAEADRFAEEMDFSPLYDENRNLLRVGYTVSDNTHDASCYGLLASEARLASFAAIAKGDVPREHWFHLGRKLAPAAGGRVLLSWSGTMFEYLMPLLWMRCYPNTIFDESMRAAVDCQRAYRKKYGFPWGISECAYNARNSDLSYRYRAFGVPELAIFNAEPEETVIAPYATILALSVRPRAAVKNLRRLAAIGMLARFGFYEAMAYGPRRGRKKPAGEAIRCFMAHHHGMSLLAIDNLLHESAMQNRFHREPSVQAVELLLQERAPTSAITIKPPTRTVPPLKREAAARPD